MYQTRSWGSSTRIFRLHPTPLLPWTLPCNIHLSSLCLLSFLMISMWPRYSNFLLFYCEHDSQLEDCNETINSLMMPWLSKWLSEKLKFLNLVKKKSQVFFNCNGLVYYSFTKCFCIISNKLTTYSIIDILKILLFSQSSNVLLKYSYWAYLYN